MAYEYKNHIADITALLIEQFKTQPNIVAFLTSFINRIQVIEDDIRDINAGFDVNTAAGDQLDKLGIIVGAERGEYTDDQYRQLIKATVLQHMSSGTSDELLNILNAIAQLDYYINDYYPASFEIGTDDNITDNIDLALALSLISISSPAGVRGIFRYAETDVLFTFDAAAANGFGNGYFTNAL